MADACILLADGFEEIEAITLIDVLRRAHVDVMVLGVKGLDVRGAHHVRLHADGLLRDHTDAPWDAVILPGGSVGTQVLRDDPEVQAFLRTQASRPDVILAAICAAPIALAQAGILQGRRATCYPGFENQLEGATHVAETVVADGPVLTSRGPGTAMEFALSLASRLATPPAAATIKAGMLVDAPRSVDGGQMSAPRH